MFAQGLSLLKKIKFLKYKHQFPGKRNLRPDLNGALFMERGGRKKREWRAEMFAQIKNIRKKIVPLSKDYLALM